MIDFHYGSPLKAFIQGMIREKQALGYKYQSSARVLYRFDQFCVKRKATGPVLTKELVQSWVEKKPNEAPATLNIRVGVVRQLGLYINRLGESAYILPPKAIPKPPRYTPYIFSNQEIVALFNKIDNCHYCAEVPLRHLMLPVLFRLLYCCGLRISEALNLKLHNVDLQAGILTILDGKFDKDRLIPLHINLAERVTEYVSKAHLFSDGHVFLFPAPTGASLTKGNVYKNFRRFLWQCRISHGGWGKGPRLHDFRHTFSVHCLRKWVREGKDLAAYLPILQTYLGHNSYSDTAQYLRLTADLYPDITTKVEQAFGHIVPATEGGNHETN
jgi:integrase/recombinase XerD